MGMLKMKSFSSYYTNHLNTSPIIGINIDNCRYIYIYSIRKIFLCLEEKKILIEVEMLFFPIYPHRRQLKY